MFPGRRSFPPLNVFHQPAGAIQETARDQKAEDDQNDVADCHILRPRFARGFY
jgi:hypothetical protein